MNLSDLRLHIYNTILELSTEQGINASGKNDVFGCIFGRDSAITILKLLKVLGDNPNASELELSKLQDICRRGLLTLVSLQGKETNIESGEEPGKFIHEYRPDNYERLLTLEAKPWYIYPDGVLRNYDSLDSTPLSLIAIHKYWKITGDNGFLLKSLPAVENGLNWIISYGDRDKDFLLEYELSEERTHGGLKVQSWTDSHESLLQKDGTFPLYPIAPVEVQGYAWLALNLWADFYEETEVESVRSESFARKLRSQATSLKKRFNEIFIFNEGKYLYPAQALDGNKNKIETVTGSPLLLLWATYQKNGSKETILDDHYIEHLVRRSFEKDMFDEDAGIRTMSENAATFVPGQNSYHNGSFWPVLNGMSHEGLVYWGYAEEAKKLHTASMKPITFFGSPIELYVKDEKETYVLYKNPLGQESCREQAWSAAAALDFLTL